MHVTDDGAHFILLRHDVYEQLQAAVSMATALLRPCVDSSETLLLADQSWCPPSELGGDRLLRAQVDRRILPKGAATVDPIYLLSSCEPAYQLRWSLALFSTSPIPPSQTWQTELDAALDADGIRILESNRSAKGALLLLLSTQPQVKPLMIVQRVKGRLQHLLSLANCPASGGIRFCGHDARRHSSIG